MSVEKNLAIICVVLMVCLAGFGCWTYARVGNLEKQITDLEADNDQLEAQVEDLENQVNTIQDALASLDFTFMNTEEISTISGTWGSNYVNITLSTRSAVVFTGALVDDKPTTCSYDGTAITQDTPYSVAKGTSVTIKVMNVDSGNWTAGLPYKITIVTSSSQYPWIGNANP